MKRVLMICTLIEKGCVWCSSAGWRSEPTARGRGGRGADHRSGHHVL